jgi:hypothetical protein
MHEMAVWSDDYALLDEIEKLEHADVTYGRVCLDDASSLENVTAYVALAANLVSLLAAVLPLVYARTANRKKSTKIYVRTTEVTAELEQVLVKYRQSVSIEVVKRGNSPTDQKDF